MARSVARPGSLLSFPRLSSVAERFRMDAWTALALVFAAGGAAYVIAISVLRWRHLETNAFDLAFFDQIVWNTSQGRWFDTTFVPYNFAGQHVQLILLPFALAYRLFGVGPVFLTTTQGLVVALAALPLYAAARRFGIAGPLALAISGTYLLNPYLHRAVQFDFHPEVMAAFPAFVSAWAIAVRKYRLASALAVALLVFKEDAVFMTLGLAGLLWLEGARRYALLTVVVSVAYTALVVLILMPYLREGIPSDLVERYGYLVGARDQSEVLPGLLTQPWVVPQHLADAGRLWTMALFVLASAPLAIARPWLLIPLVPGMTLAVLATHPSQSRLELHYAAELVPVALIASTIAVRDLLSRRRDSSWATVSAAAIVLPAVVSFLALSPFSPFEDSPAPPSRVHREAVDEAVAIIPAGVPVSAQSHVLPRLSQREDAFEFPNRHESVDWVVVDRNGHRSSQSLAAGFDDALADVRLEFERVYDSDGVEVYRRRP